MYKEKGKKPLQKCIALFVSKFYNNKIEFENNCTILFLCML